MVCKNFCIGSKTSCTFFCLYWINSFCVEYLCKWRNKPEWFSSPPFQKKCHCFCWSFYGHLANHRKKWLSDCRCIISKFFMVMHTLVWIFFKVSFFFYQIIKPFDCDSTNFSIPLQPWTMKAPSWQKKFMIKKVLLNCSTKQSRNAKENHLWRYCTGNAMHFVASRPKLLSLLAKSCKR